MGMEKAFQNAKELYEDGILLKGYGKICRAFYLFHMATEECAKVEILSAEFSRYSWKPNKVDTDPKELIKQFTHIEQNKIIAPGEGFSKEEIDAYRKGDNELFLEEFEKTKTNYHNGINKLKNASLYVQIENNQFKGPGETISEEIMIKEMEKAEKWLRMMDLIVRSVLQMDLNHFGTA